VNLYRVVPPTSATIPFEQAKDHLAFLPELTPETLPWVRVNMVTNSEGILVDDTGTSRGLSLGADRALLRLYRQSADLVVMGARTIRAETIPLPETTPLCVVTKSGDLSDHRLSAKPGQGIFIVTSKAGAIKAEATLRDIPSKILTVESEENFDAADIMKALAGATPTEHILVEGGRMLYETFASVTNELCISVTPPPLSPNQGIPGWWPTSRENWELVSLLSDDKRMLYFRYQTKRNGVPSN
jgi:riboflavin biosynthesis pyrimidine reductase